MPPYVGTREEVERWELCVAVAAGAMGEIPASESVWFAARVLYHSSIPT
jgi:hypothetical protein